MYNNKKIGFSFSGGSSRSSAHIGIIQALNENGIKADFVSGTSGGAIVGALYAANLAVPKMLEFAAKGKLSKIYKPRFPMQGITGLEYLGELLTEYVSVKNLEELALPLFVTVANLGSGDKEVLKSGNLNAAVMASSAIPLVFNPVVINGKIYADGGLFDNLPVEPLVSKCDVIIGMNVMPSTAMPKEELDDMFTILRRVLNMTIAYNSKASYPMCDVVIEPKEVVNYGLLDFSSSKEMYDFGYKAGLEKVAEIKRILEQ